MLEDYSVHEYDVLVIGAGGWTEAAIEAALQVLKLIISKSMLGKAHTVMAEGCSRCPCQQG